MSTDCIAPNETVFSRLRPALLFGRHKTRAGESITLGDFLDALGPNSQSAAVLLLAMPFLWPLSLGPVTTPASAVLLIIGISMVRGREGFPIPHKYLRVPMPRWVFRLMRRWTLVLARRGNWNRTRAGRREFSPRMAKATGYGIVAGAILMAVPIPLLPLTNTFPALALVFFGLAQLKLSYAKLLIACGFLVLSVLLFVALGIGIAVLGLEGVRALFGL